MHENPEIESKFRLVHIAARRAEQLMQGARARVESRHVKPTRVALDEVKGNLVRWQLPETLSLRQEEAVPELDPLLTDSGLE
ncbi:MAG: DNA-directed RNA polymerase subunit omega [Acidobacteria bacterium]|nr:DNA-directed RNA polymerase subunit omega [Acidobacteriota bacterium]MCG3194314.1 DNA-directed RNA polymerase subunit omega [Thermoanaerobaculia bacterium]MCK6681906.1 DNA-directed RNA polymerase subunit omega [Thermoanaerobaculia bacterium]